MRGEHDDRHDAGPGLDPSGTGSGLPGTPEGLKRLLAKVQNWAPYVDGLLLDDVADVLDDHMPGEDEVAEHAQRLCSHLTRLVNLAVASTADERNRGVADLVERGRELWSQALPAEHAQAVGHIRRMAWTLNALLELLVKHQCITSEP
ncbi:DUF6415 family natural product biosynthesis protein [Streptomyces sp. NPDC001642]|uniref:DUF6415 family natural product biosynthesis protein n=1 Tax=Streptomyces sp. NPDC001642 TaxID=3154392 RepID=UPI00331FF771